ncbi:phasin family protein [Pseudomonas sp. DC3000-4b1]|uniref:phasin family protein n=1 Tax=unclassified Pseudomonas TaxID=196821 RepID=UPI003CFAF5B9
MASKKKVDKETASWMGGIEKYSRQIWLAGLGAYARGAADGHKQFEALVKEGEKAEKLARGEIDKQIGQQVETAKAVAGTKASSLKEKSLGKWGELEDAFDTRLDSAVSRLGLPTREEIAALQQKVDLVMSQLQRLTGVSAAQPEAAIPSQVSKAVKAPRRAAKITEGTSPASAGATKPTTSTRITAAKSGAATKAAKPKAVKAPVSDGL